MRRWIGGGKCTCVRPVAENGPCPACTFSAEQEEFIQEHPQDDPDAERGIEVAERMHEKWLDGVA